MHTVVGAHDLGIVRSSSQVCQRAKGPRLHNSQRLRGIAEPNDPPPWRSAVLSQHTFGGELSPADRS